MFLYVVDWPFNLLLVSVKVTLFKVTELAPSITTPSYAVASKVALDTVISAVE